MLPSSVAGTGLSARSAIAQALQPRVRRALGVPRKRPDVAELLQEQAKGGH